MTPPGSPYPGKLVSFPSLAAWGLALAHSSDITLILFAVDTKLESGEWEGGKRDNAHDGQRLFLILNSQITSSEASRIIWGVRG